MSKKYVCRFETNGGSKDPNKSMIRLFKVKSIDYEMKINKIIHNVSKILSTLPLLDGLFMWFICRLNSTH